MGRNVGATLMAPECGSAAATPEIAAAAAAAVAVAAAGGAAAAMIGVTLAIGAAPNDPAVW